MTQDTQAPWNKGVWYLAGTEHPSLGWVIILGQRPYCSMVGGRKVAGKVECPGWPDVSMTCEPILALGEFLVSFLISPQKPLRSL